MIGSRLGPYEITAKLGEGGMGEVYRATDTKLDRQVAIKVLPAAFTADPERLARFEREAKILAQLHHPNIASIFGLEEGDRTAGGVRALVMELVEGEDLSNRIARGTVPIDEALPIARQIAEALEFAHEQGIVHRDLKPANVKLRPDGTVKVLDFGLAKAMDPAATPTAAVPFANSPTLMNSPTLADTRGTQLGMILGTAAYMSPEQAKGAVVDKRVDIWSFGVLLFEMLTGKPLFAGDSVPEMLAGVLRNDIDFAALPSETPLEVRRLLRRCLERNPKARLRDVGEARVALDPVISVALAETVGERAPACEPARPVPFSRRALPWVLVALLAIALGWVWWRGTRPGRATAPERTAVLALHLPAELSIPLDDRGVYGQTGVLAVSSKGDRVAFLEGVIGKGAIYVRDLDHAEYRKLEGTEGASSPFFSPDGQWIGYFAPGKLRKISVDGGRPIDLAPAALDRGGVWCPDGSIVFSPGATDRLYRLAPGAAAATALTALDETHAERTHRWPAVLPGGREVAFTVGVAGKPGDYEDSDIDAVDLASGKRRQLFRGASMVRFTSSGLALLGREGQVLATPLAGAHGQNIGDARVVLRNVAGVPASGVVHFGVGEDGTLIYAERDPQASELEVVWISATGEARTIALPHGEYRQFQFSPDGKRVATAVGPGGGRGGDIWILELASGALSKLTFDGHSWSPAWSRDGKSVIYTTSLASGAEEFRIRPADGSEDARAVKRFPTSQARGRAPVAWMPDGSLLFWEDGGANSGGNLLYLPPGGGDALPFASTPAVEIQPAVSPDGRYVAYDYDDSGQPSVYVQPFPPTGAKWLVAEGASVALWSQDGRRLYFARGREINEVPVSVTGAFAAGAPVKQFDFPVGAILTSDTATAYAVAPDGRFLAARSTSREPMGGHLVVILHWFDALQRLVSGGEP
ncbi:MAG: protein kinase [Acidobacteriota bacterium]